MDFCESLKCTSVPSVLKVDVSKITQAITQKHLKAICVDKSAVVMLSKIKTLPVFYVANNHDTLRVELFL